jgi:glycosyltransferase involved in cell wall biosynthesis
VALGHACGQPQVQQLGRAEAAAEIRLVMVCYDLIPILFPQFYLQRDRDVFLNYFRKAISFVDKFICISNHTARDVANFAAEQGQPLREVSVQYLGSGLPNVEDASLPATLTRRHYALYVSTIEPRKNHELLYRIWRRLLECGLPQTHCFQLVFVGRPGWGTDDLIRKLTNDPLLKGYFRYFPNVNDSELARLYRDAAFCLYPSRYEGFGLPIVEAFNYGRAVIASNGGSIVEAVQDICPCLDPNDEDAWYETLHQWIEDPKVVTSYETKIIGSFHHQPWSQAAKRYFAEAEI